MAVHDLDLARFLVGEVEEVFAWGDVLIDERFAKAKDVDTARLPAPYIRSPSVPLRLNLDRFNILRLWL